MPKQVRTINVEARIEICIQLEMDETLSRERIEKEIEKAYKDKLWHYLVGYRSVNERIDTI